jgi:hypothetical protein
MRMYASYVPCTLKYTIDSLPLSAQ